MELLLLERLTNKLGQNLEVIQRSINFADSVAISSTSASSNSDDYELVTIKDTLTALLVFKSEPDDLKKFLDQVNKKTPNVISNASEKISYLGFKHDPLVESFRFHAEADRILREIDVQIHAICEVLSQSPPQTSSPNAANTSDNWGRQTFLKAVNIVKAAKSLLEEK